MFENMFDIGTCEIRARVEGTRTILIWLQEGNAYSQVQICLWVVAWETCLQNLGQLEDHNNLPYGGFEDWAQQATILEDLKTKTFRAPGWIEFFIKG
jgi:hypothetical protein